MAKQKQQTFENRFEPLYDFLMKEKRLDFVLTFEEIEEILGFGLPRSADRAEWWDDGTAEHPKMQAEAIRQAGYDSRRMPDGKSVRFRKFSTLPPKSRRDRAIEY
jgi:hypothetical protein